MIFREEVLKITVEIDAKDLQRVKSHILLVILDAVDRRIVDPCYLLEPVLTYLTP